jgi:hypothetical protein
MILNVLPFPSRLSSSILPLLAQTAHWTMDKPNPAPPISRERPLSTR